MPKKNEVILIRTDRETKKEFRRFMIENDFKSYDEVLKFLLRKARELNLKPESGRFL